MRIILLGSPGSGKGTQGPVLAEHFGATHISTGEMLREAIVSGSDLGRLVEGYVRAGKLVPDDVVLAMLLEPIAQAVATGGYVLDGFPRTLRQAESAYEFASATGATADAVVYLAVPDDVVRERLLHRARHGRPDDADPEVIEHRLEVFHAETEPLLRYYSERGLLVPVDASGPPEEVRRSMIAAIEGIRSEQ
jgi:adenylate kinase